MRVSIIFVTAWPFRRSSYYHSITLNICKSEFPSFSKWGVMRSYSIFSTHSFNIFNVGKLDIHKKTPHSTYSNGWTCLKLLGNVNSDIVWLCERKLNSRNLSYFLQSTHNAHNIAVHSGRKYGTLFWFGSHTVWSLSLSVCVRYFLISNSISTRINCVEH